MRYNQIKSLSGVLRNKSLYGVLGNKSHSEFSELSPILVSPEIKDVFLCSRFGDTYTIMLHVCGPSARSGKIFELVQSYFPGASIRVSTKPITLNCLN